MNPVNNDNFATDFKINLSDDFDYKKEFNSYEPNPENINNKHFEDNDAENHTLNNSEHEKSISLGIDKPIPPNININIDDPDFKPQEKPIYYQSEDINNPSAAMIAHNLNPDVQPNQNLPKKNKTLQYFKFLLYSTKVEVKLHEFLDILRFGSQTEITLWIISMVLYFNGKFRNIIIFFQVLHVIRGLIGYVIRIYFPKMHEIIESTKADDRTMETMEFNDFIRKIAKEKLIPKIQKASKWIIVYIILTCLCFIIDCINFLYVLSNLDEAGPSLEYRVNKNLVYFTMFMVSFLFISIDLSYILWANTLRYTFPPEMLFPIKQAFSGYAQSAMVRFKLTRGPNANNNNRNNVEVQGSSLGHNQLQTNNNIELNKV